jgi:hypothetical protein
MEEDRDFEEALAVDMMACRVCGCTEDDCQQCVEVQGFPCSWVEFYPPLCTRCLFEGHKPKTAMGRMRARAFRRERKLAMKGAQSP